MRKVFPLLLANTMKSKRRTRDPRQLWAKSIQQCVHLVPFLCKAVQTLPATVACSIFNDELARHTIASPFLFPNGFEHTRRSNFEHYAVRFATTKTLTRCLFAFAVTAIDTQLHETPSYYSFFFQCFFTQAVHVVLAQSLQERQSGIEGL